MGVLGALATWQLLAMVGPLSDSPLPTATESIAALGQMLATAGLWVSIWDTVLMAFIGLAIATVAGVFLGIGIGVSPLAMHATRVPLEFLKPIPPIVILPIVMLVLGPTLAMGIFLVFIGCFVSIVVQSSAGVFDTDPVAKATGEMYGLGKGEAMSQIVLPSALPYIGTAIRVAAPTALIVAVVAGLIGGGPGLGQSVLLAQISGNQPQLFAYVLVLGLLGLLVQGVSQWVESRVLFWHPQYRRTGA